MYEGQGMLERVCSALSKISGSLESSHQGESTIANAEYRPWESEFIFQQLRVESLIMGKLAHFLNTKGKKLGGKWEKECGVFVGFESIYREHDYGKVHSTNIGNITIIFLP